MALAFGKNLSIESTPGGPKVVGSYSKQKRALKNHL